MFVAPWPAIRYVVRDSYWDRDGHRYDRNGRRYDDDNYYASHGYGDGYYGERYYRGY